MAAFKTIVVATDFSELGQAAIDRGCDLARSCGARVHVVHVVSDIFHEPWAGFVHANALEAELARERSSAVGRLSGLMALKGLQPAAITAAVAGPEPAEEIIAYAKRHDADLIVCGTHGRHGLNRLLLGSVAERIVHDAPCAVLTVRSVDSTATESHEVASATSTGTSVDEGRRATGSVGTSSTVSTTGSDWRPLAMAELASLATLRERSGRS